MQSRMPEPGKIKCCCLCVICPLMVAIAIVLISVIVAVPIFVKILDSVNYQLSTVQLGGRGFENYTVQTNQSLNGMVYKGVEAVSGCRKVGSGITLVLSPQRDIATQTKSETINRTLTFGPGIEKGQVYVHSGFVYNVTVERKDPTIVFNYEVTLTSLRDGSTRNVCQRNVTMDNDLILNLVCLSNSSGYYDVSFHVPQQYDETAGVIYGNVSYNVIDNSVYFNSKSCSTRPPQTERCFVPIETKPTTYEVLMVVNSIEGCQVDYKFIGRHQEYGYIVFFTLGAIVFLFVLIAVVSIVALCCFMESCVDRIFVNKGGEQPADEPAQDGYQAIN